MGSPNPDKLPDICKVQLLDYPIEKVWNAVSTPEGIAEWFVPNDFQPVEGHQFIMDMHKPQGKTACKVTQINAPRRLTYDVGKDWHWTFLLSEQDDRTELTFIWSGWDASKTAEIGMSHTMLHAQLIDGTNVLMKSLARSINKLSSARKVKSYEGEVHMQQVDLRVSGMSCGNCVRSVKKALEDIGASGRVSLKNGSVTVKYDENHLSLEAVMNAIEDLGYDIV